MEIQDLATAVLFGDRLEDKLVSPDSRTLTDRRRRGALANAPSAPGRPHRLRIDTGRPRLRFPSPGQLTDPLARGRALHFFANHELLAMELMALVLLRFPQAPDGFRRGVAHTLLEEQDHLRRYRARMEALGVGLGDVPVSDFFWATMADMASPLDYVVRMSMTFEQANLDHARHYARLFRDVGDQTTADLMDLVYEEELGHVQHGVTWFNRWRIDDAPRPDESDWSAYCRLLPAPLSARRARGQPYVFEARRQVGLSETFARQLEIYSHSRGRSPTVWLFEPDFEAQIGSSTGPSSAVSRSVARDLAPVLMPLAASDDVVVTPVRPGSDILTRLTRAGLDVPELVEAEPATVAEVLRQRPVGGVEGWAETATVRALKATLGLAPALAPDPRVSSKIWAAEQLADLPSDCPEWADLLGPPQTVGRGCQTRGEVDEVRRQARDAGFDTIIVKRPFSASGQARRRYPTAAEPADRWLERALAQGPVLAEPWLDRHCDLSTLVEVTDEDLDKGRAPRRVAAMPFVTGRQGVYRGHVLAEPTFGLPEALIRRLAFGVAGGFAGRLARLAAFVRHRLALLGHRGPAAIDVLIYRPPGVVDPGSWAVKPIVEINARRTMGHVAWALKQKLAPGRFGLWVHRPVHPGDPSRVRAWPDIETRSFGRSLRLERGLLATTDPSTAESIWTFVAVGRDLAEVESLIAEHLDEDALRPFRGWTA